MLYALKQFFYGLISSILSILEFKEFINTKTYSIKYFKVISINLLLLTCSNYLFNLLETNIYDKNNGTVVSSLYYSVYFIHHILWNIPAYLVCYVVSLDKLGGVFKCIDNKGKNIIENFDSKIYFCFLSTTFYFITNLIYLLPKIGTYIGFIFLSYSYGFCCLEYSCYYKNISNINKLAIIESNPYFFIGYGLLYSILVSYFTYINFFVLFVMIFPLGVIKLTKLNIYTLENKNHISRIFIIPIIILNTLLSLVDSYIICKYVKED